jgi:hypothetical protein
MKSLLCLSLLPALAAAALKLEARELQYGFCKGSPEPFSIDEVVVEPYPVVVASGATIHVAVGITLNEAIPVGSTATLKVANLDTIDIPLPCLTLQDGSRWGSW